MDRFVATLPSREDGDLALCLAHGVAFQRDMDKVVRYDESYFAKCAGYEGKDIALAINRGRVELVAKHFSPVARVVDIGIGSGEFIKNRPNTWGHDINPAAEEWLRALRRWVPTSDLNRFWAFTFWDVIEHVPEPADYFQHIPEGGYLFTSVPIFEDLTRIRESRHYRPGEHLYYWTDAGFVQWMALHGFKLLERQDFEMKAGRENIYSYAFVREES